MKQTSRSRVATPVSKVSGNVQRDAFLATLDRLKTVIDRETSMLRTHTTVELDVFNQQKQQGLLELTRQVRTLSSTAPDAEICNRLGELRIELEKNAYALQTHLRAVQEVSAIVTRTIQDADSDGTYSLGANLRLRKPT